MAEQKEELIKLIYDNYGIKPDYLWAKDPSSCALRHPESGKWFAVMMRIKREKVGLAGKGMLDIVDVKCDPLMTGSVLTNEGMYPAYHMNKKNWITIVLDGTVDIGEIMMLVDMSYQMTLPKVKTAPVRRIPYWIVPINNKYYDIEEAIDNAPDEPIPWRQRYNFQKGDTVYMYVTAPVSAIKFKFVVDKVEILPVKHHNKEVYLRFVRKYDESVFTFAKLKEHGVYAVRGPRSIPRSLVKAIEEYEEENPG